MHSSICTLELFFLGLKVFLAGLDLHMYTNSITDGVLLRQGLYQYRTAFYNVSLVATVSPVCPTPVHRCL